jgi:hypothetical protein
MKIDVIIIDNFYSNPDELVKNAKQLEFFDKYGNHPGRRTKEQYDPIVKQMVQDAIQTAGGKITNWEDMPYNTCFNSCTSRDRSWVHTDQYNGWAGVVYLNKDPHTLNAGTAFFKHKATGIERAPRFENGEFDVDKMSELYKEAQDWTKWQQTDYMANKYNRLVLYRGDIIHSAVNYFGTNLEDGRFHQTFFFNTEH